MDNYRLKPNQDFMMIFLCLFCIFNESKQSRNVFMGKCWVFANISILYQEEFTFCVNHNLFSYGSSLWLHYRYHIGSHNWILRHVGDIEQLEILKKEHLIPNNIMQFIKFILWCSLGVIMAQIFLHEYKAICHSSHTLNIYQ